MLIFSLYDKQEFNSLDKDDADAADLQSLIADNQSIKKMNLRHPRHLRLKNITS